MLDKAVAERIVHDYKVEATLYRYNANNLSPFFGSLFILKIQILLLLKKDIFKQATEDRLTSAKELPYFEGDFWPNVLEESIKELEQEEEERKREENSTSNESIDVSVLSSNIV